MWRLKTEGWKLGASLKYAHCARVRPRGSQWMDFPIDMLRYDRAHPLRLEDCKMIRTILASTISENPSPSQSVYVVKYTELSRREKQWFIDGWWGNSCLIDPDMHPELGDEIHRSLSCPKLVKPFKYCHLAELKPNKNYNFDFPVELFHDDQCYPFDQGDAGTIDLILTPYAQLEAEKINKPIRVMKHSAQPIGEWKYEAWEKAGWDCEAISRDTL